MSKRPIWRRKVDGKFIGSWHFTAPGGKRVNTRTDDADAALKFRLRWLRDNRPSHKVPAAGQTGSQGAAEATLAALDGATGDLRPSNTEPPPPAHPPAAVDAPSPRPAVMPDGYAPPPVDPSAWASEAAQAAAGSAGSSAPPLPAIDPAFIESMLEMAADRLVTLQVLGQALAIRYVGGLLPGEASIDETSRQIAREGWKTTLRTLLPNTIDNWPPWAIALGVTALATLPVQIMNAKPIPKKEPGSGEQPQSEAQPVAA